MMATIKVEAEIDIPKIHRIEREFDLAVLDRDVTGIRFWIDTPGGVYCDEFINFCERIYKARDQKTILAITKHQCLSAGFWLASATSAIWALSPEAEIGAIGTLVPQDFSEYVGRAPHPTTPEGEARKEELLRVVRQTLIENTAPAENEVFLLAVARYRGMPLERIREIADWKRIYSAKDALHLGLIDEII